MATDTAESIKRLEDKVDSLEGEKAVLQQRLPKATDAEAGIIIEAISAKDKQITALRTDITELRKQSTAAGGQAAVGPAGRILKVPICVGNKWGWREEKVQLDDDDLVDIARVEKGCNIHVTGFWITDANMDPSTLKKSERQRRREQVYVQPGQVLWLQAKRAGAGSLLHNVKMAAVRVLGTAVVSAAVHSVLTKPDKIMEFVKAAILEKLWRDRFQRRPQTEGTTATAAAMPAEQHQPSPADLYTYLGAPFFAFILAAAKIAGTVDASYHLALHDEAYLYRPPHQ